MTRIKKNKKLLVGAAIGNTLEFYDYALNGILILVIAKVFFPQDGQIKPLIGGLATFLIAYISRPLGAVIFGYIGDRFGRATSVGYSLLIMSIPTMVIAITPSYEVLGALSPLILFACRFTQGVCMGGEYNGAAIYALENIAEKRGLVGGILCSSCVFGALLATLFGTWVQLIEQSEFYFRFLYVLGSLIAFAGFFIRRSHVLNEFKPTYDQTTLKTFPLSEIWNGYKAEFLLVLFMGGMNGVLSYALVSFINLFCHEFLSLSQSVIFYSIILHLLTVSILSVFIGTLSDRIPIRSYMRLSLICISVFSVIAFHCFEYSDEQLLYLGQILMGIAVASYIGPCFVYCQNVFPRKLRSTGISVAYSAGMSLTAGILPVVLYIAVSHTEVLYFPGYVIAAVSLLTLIMNGFLDKVVRNKGISSHQINQQVEYNMLEAPAH